MILTLISIKRLVHVYSGSTIQSLNKNTPTIKRSERYFNDECTGLESCYKLVLGRNRVVVGVLSYYGLMFYSPSAFSSIIFFTSSIVKSLFVGELLSGNLGKLVVNLLMGQFHKSVQLLQLVSNGVRG